MAAERPVERQFPFARLSPPVILAGVVGLALFAAGVFVRPTPFLYGYLAAYLFWFGIAVGSLGAFMLWQLTGGGWGRLLQPILEASIGTLPLLAILFIPIVAGAGRLYPWSDDSIVAADSILESKSSYLNFEGFAVRAVVYFAIWLALATLLLRWSRRYYETSDSRIAGRMATLSGPGLVLWSLALSFAGIDWVMSLEPHWFSSIFPVVFGVGLLLLTLSFSIAVIVGLAAGFEAESPQDAFPIRYLHDLGNLLLAIVMFWAYVAFSQFLLIWSGNLPEETSWYLPRSRGPWFAATLVLIAGQFMLPFAALLFRGVKRRPAVLAGLAGLLVALSLLNIAWQVLPSFDDDSWIGAGLAGTSLAASFVGVGGVWLWAFLGRLRRLPPPPWVELAAEAHHG